MGFSFFFFSSLTKLRRQLGRSKDLILQALVWMSMQSIGRAHDETQSLGKPSTPVHLVPGGDGSARALPLGNRALSYPSTPRWSERKPAHKLPMNDWQRSHPLTFSSRAPASERPAEIREIRRPLTVECPCAKRNGCRSVWSPSWKSGGSGPHSRCIAAENTDSVAHSFLHTHSRLVIALCDRSDQRCYWKSLCVSKLCVVRLVKSSSLDLWRSTIHMLRLLQLDLPVRGRSTSHSLTAHARPWPVDPLSQ